MPIKMKKSYMKNANFAWNGTNKLLCNVNVHVNAIDTLAI